MRMKLFFAFLLAFSAINIRVEANVINAPAHCFACAIPDGLVVSDLTATSATLSWNTVSGATQYTVEVQDEQVNPSVFHIETNVAGTSYGVTGLTAGTLYKFKVRTRCGGEKSDWSDWVFFTAGTGGGSGTGTCDIPTQLSASVNGNAATLSWNKVNGATQYYIEVEDEQNVPSTFHVEVSVQDTFYILTGLQTNVLYKFKVRTHCGSGQSDWSGWSFFNGNFGGGIGGGNGNCSRPTGTSVSNITAQEALLSWTAVPGVATYFLEIEREQAGAAPWQITQTVTANSFLLTGLNADTRYKFKVRSNCAGGGHSNWTKWRKFKTATSLTGTPGNSNLPSTSFDRSHEATAGIANGLELKASPNPLVSTTTVRIQNLGAESATIRLFDISGRIVKQQNIQSEAGTWEGDLNLGNLPSGIYFLQVQSGTENRTIKLVLSH